MRSVGRRTVGKKELHPSTLRVLEAIREFHRRHGYGPSTRELSEMTGLRSSSTVQHHIETLKAEGLVQCGREGSGRHRSLVATYPFHVPAWRAACWTVRRCA